jgi:endogenous inhibitor of DNA gyrase (YacG/DUF329 family)
VRPAGPFSCPVRDGRLVGVTDSRVELVCSSCGRAGTTAELASGWTVSRPPRPTGADRPRTAEEERLTALCPDCARRSVRDLEARLDV